MQTVFLLLELSTVATVAEDLVEMMLETTGVQITVEILNPL